MPTMLFFQGSGIYNYSKIKFINWKLGVTIGLPMYVVVGSSLLAIAFNSVMGSLRHLQFGNLDSLLLAIMFPAAIMAGFISLQIAKRASPNVVKRVAVAGLCILGLKLLGVYEIHLGFV